ncbi:MAG: hypothetical protein ABID67_01485 [Candidatus Nealsonbacteria bacterium]
MSSKQKNNISISFFLIFFISIFFLVIYPLFKDIQSSAKELSLQENKLITLQLKIDGLEQFKNVYKGLEGDLKKKDDLLVNLEVPVEFINFLENEAQQSNLDFEITSANNYTDNFNPWSYIIFQATANGNFSNLVKFLERVENDLYLIEIININIKEAGDSNIKTTFSIKVFSK